jgi:hypothetical protein
VKPTVTLREDDHEEGGSDTDTDAESATSSKRRRKRAPPKSALERHFKRDKRSEKIPSAAASRKQVLADHFELFLTDRKIVAADLSLKKSPSSSRSYSTAMDSLPPELAAKLSEEFKAVLHHLERTGHIRRVPLSRTGLTRPPSMSADDWDVMQSVPLSAVTSYYHTMVSAQAERLWRVAKQQFPM